MHKLYTAAAITAFSFSFAYAQGIKPQFTRTLPPVPISDQEGSQRVLVNDPGTISGVQRIQDSRVMTATPVQAVGQMMVLPTTGDAVIDAQFKTLLEERNKKIKAIHEEYELKIKALLKDRKLSAPTPTMGTQQVVPVSQIRTAPIQNMVVDARTRLQMTDDGETVVGSYNGMPEMSPNPASGGRYPMQAGVAKTVPKPAFPIEKSKTLQYESPFRGLLNTTR